MHKEWFRPDVLLVVCGEGEGLWAYVSWGSRERSYRSNSADC
eukprot:COSAG04_NODE_11536_length_703_cov_2.048013_3_plen_41_part_01